MALPFSLIVLDLDGTLNNDDKEISPETLRALMRAQQQGVRVVLASGRATGGFTRERHWLQLDQYAGLLITYNGALVLRADTDELLFDASIPAALAREYVQHVQALPVNPIVDDGQQFYTEDAESFQMEYESRNNGMPIQVVPQLAQAITFSPAKVLVAAPPEVLERHREAAMTPFAGQLEGVLSAPFYMEVTLPGVGKRPALERLCAGLGVAPEQVLAFGDGANDVDMVRFAGHGVAMGNGCEAILQAADEVTASNNEDGIARVLGRFFQE